MTGVNFFRLKEKGNQKGPTKIASVYLTVLSVYLNVWSVCLTVLSIYLTVLSVFLNVSSMTGSRETIEIWKEVVTDVRTIEKLVKARDRIRQV
jgi:hypothetical protein